MKSAESPNHALQRTRSAVTAAASGLRLAATMQPPRQLRASLSLGSLGRFPPRALSSITASQFGSRGRGWRGGGVGRFTARASSVAARRADGFDFEFGW